MSYTLTNLGFRDFKCYRGEHEIDLAGRPVVAVVGSYAGADGRSNWSGKSTIGDALRFLFYGEHPSDLAQDMVSWGARQSVVWGTLTDLATGDEVPIERSVQAKGGGTLTVGGIEGVSRATEELSRVLGLSYRDWLITAFFEQGDVLRFCKKRPAEKRAEVQRWMERAYWERLRLNASKRLAALVEESAKDSAIVAMEREKPSEVQKLLKPAATRRFGLRESAQDARRRHERYVGGRERLEAALDALETLQDRLWAFTVAWGKLERYPELRYLEGRIREAAADRKRMEAVVQGCRDGYREANRDLQQMEANARGEFDGMCPVDGEACPRRGEICAATEQFQAEVAPLRKRVATAKDEGREAVAQRDSAAEVIRVMERERAELAADLRIPDPFPEAPEGQEWPAAVLEVRDAQAELNAAWEALGSARDDMEALQAAEREVGALEERLKRAQRKETEAVEAKARLEAKESQIAALTFLVYAFGKDGVPSRQVEVALDKIAEEADRRLGRLGTGLGVRFNYEKTLKKKSDVCYDCGAIFPPRTRKCPGCGQPRPFKRADDLSIDVSVDGTWGSFELQSGGCQALVAIMLRLATSQMLRQEGRLTVPMGWIDEILGMLDQANRVALAREIITGGDLGLQQRMVVTHDRLVQGMFPDILTVERDGKWSTVGWA